MKKWLTQHELSTHMWSGCAPWNCGKFVRNFFAVFSSFKLLGIRKHLMTGPARNSDFYFSLTLWYVQYWTLMRFKFLMVSIDHKVSSLVKGHQNTQNSHCRPAHFDWVACDQVVLLETAANLWARWRQANDFFRVFSSFELGGVTKHLMTEVSPRSSVQHSFFYWCKTTWTWPNSFTKSRFPWGARLTETKPPSFPPPAG